MGDHPLRKTYSRQLTKKCLFLRDNLQVRLRTVEGVSIQSEKHERLQRLRGKRAKGAPASQDQQRGEVQEAGKSLNCASDEYDEHCE